LGIMNTKTCKRHIREVEQIIVLVLRGQQRRFLLISTERPRRLAIRFAIRSRISGQA
jgi:hypothetical protein